MEREISAEFLLINNLSVRPTSGNGLWTLFLLPLAVIVSSMRHPIILTSSYKVAAVVSLSLLGHSLYIVTTYRKKEKLKAYSTWSFVNVLITACLLKFHLNLGLVLSLLIALSTSSIYLGLFISFLRELRQSFTLGEAGLIAQGGTLFLNSASLNLFSRVTKSNMQIYTTIIQIGLLGLLVLAYAVRTFQLSSPKAFYATAFGVITVFIIIPLHAILKSSPFWWIFNKIWSDALLLKLFLYWSTCIALAVLAISNQIYYAQKASTATRKIFHILAVLVYIPGLYYRCSFLYLSTGVVLGIFFALEILRLLTIAPLGTHLQNGFVVFRDDKDTGLLALTPIYLLVGVSIPLWLHPAPCDVTDSSQFALLPLLSGLASIGVGDTAASYVGSKFGRYYWAESSKTIEGTLAMVLSQLGFFYFLYYLGILTYPTKENVIRILAAVLLGSVVEAKTSQIDNLVLPLIMYIILI